MHEKMNRTTTIGISVTKLLSLLICIVVIVSAVSYGISAQFTSNDTRSAEMSPPVNPEPGDDTEQWSDTGADIVVLGDSTAALGEQPTVGGSPNDCIHGADSWPNLVAMRTGMTLADYSCSATTTRQGLTYVDEAPIGETTRYVLIAYGSNDAALRKEVVEDITDQLLEMVTAVRKKTSAFILLVGYLEFDTSGCPASKRLNQIAAAHSTANEAMKKTGERYIAPAVIPKVCSPESVISRPGDGRGVAWHNLSAAHTLVSDAVIEAIRTTP